MPSSALVRTVFREWITRESSRRIPEPALVMDDPLQVAAYVEAGRERAVMAAVYLFHAANVCEVVRPGDTVLDLACGPANQLALVARLNPDVRFVGVDSSEEMLTQARALVAEQRLDNVTFHRGDITDLGTFETASIDAVLSTMALHHLPDVSALFSTFEEVDRVLVRRGGLYLADFGHLRSEKSIEYFANQYVDRQPELFTRDYRNSLRAAFFLDDLRQCAQVLSRRARLYSTFGLPFMVAIKSHSRREHDARLVSEVVRMRDSLRSWHKSDLSDLIRHFRIGGMACSLLA